MIKGLLQYINNNETLQTTHRSLNSVLMILVVVLGFKQLSPIYDEISGLKAQRVIDSEIAQIVKDEGFRSKPYRDSLGLWTIGFGHLIKEGETFENLTPHHAVQMLRKDYTSATNSVEKNYPWAEGDVKLVLINMTYQMGAVGVSKFEKTISHLRDKEYDLAAGEMLTSRWAAQTPLRASRLAGRIMALEK